MRRRLPFPEAAKRTGGSAAELGGALPSWLQKLPIDAAYRPLMIIGIGLTLGVIVGWKVKRL